MGPAAHTGRNTSSVRGNVNLSFTKDRPPSAGGVGPQKALRKRLLPWERLQDSLVKQGKVIVAECRVDAVIGYLSGNALAPVEAIPIALTKHGESMQILANVLDVRNPILEARESFNAWQKLVALQIFPIFNKGNYGDLGMRVDVFSGNVCYKHMKEFMRLQSTIRRPTLHSGRNLVLTPLGRRR